MKKNIKSYLIGFVSAAVLLGGTAYAVNTTNLYDVIVGGIRVFVDGQEVIPTDANGNRVDPIIYNGTTYLPVRAIASAVGKAVYWDGPTYTAYLGNMDGQLQYPSVLLEDLDNIGERFNEVDSNKLTDNYGNTYSTALYKYGSGTLETILNMKYSRFRCVLYTPKGDNYDEPTLVTIKTDGKTVYSSSEITKTSRPISVDVDVTGCNIFEIEVTGHGDRHGFIADAGFYQ